MKQSTDFARLTTGFLNSYLPNEKGASVNTIKSYSYTFILLIKYMREIKNVHASKLSFIHLNKEVIVGFLDWLQKERKCSDVTCNQRLAAISSFIKYAESMIPDRLFDCNQILSIPVKKVQSRIIDYLNIEGIKLLLRQPDPQKAKELRDLALVSLMYESAARVQEMIDLTPANLYVVDKPYRVLLHGKGNKYRSVPLPEKEAKLLQRYMMQMVFLTGRIHKDLYSRITKVRE